jgi:putative endopeptidase
MRRCFVAFLFVSLPLAAVFGQTQTRSRTAVETASLDRAFEPCTDFYQFACGAWIEKTPLPADRLSYGRMQEVQDQNFAILRRILEKPGATGDLRKASDYYAACVDTATIEARGLEPIKPLLARIDALSSRERLPELVGYLHRVAAGPPPLTTPTSPSAFAFFSFVGRSDPQDSKKQIAWIRPDGLALPGRDSYVKTDERAVARRREYRAHIVKMMMLAGEAEARASASADAVLEIETSLSNASLDAAARRNPDALNHRMTLADVQVMAPGLDWQRYLTAAGVPTPDLFNVPQPEFVKNVSQIAATMPLDTIKSYLRWHLVHGAAMVLPKAFVDADFDFFSRSLLGQQRPQPQWRQCVTRTDEQLGEALGQAFVAEAFPPQARQDMLRMARDIRAALARDIDSLSWMSAATKGAALEKLNAVEDRIGYPDRWRDYSSVRTARDDAFGNLVRVREWDNARDRARIGRPTDRGEWAMTPPTVNSYYSTDRNSINFSAGILQPPFYQPGRDAAGARPGLERVTGSLT